MAYANDGGNGEYGADEDAPAEVVQGGVVDCLGVGIPDSAEEYREEEDGGEEDVEEGWRDDDTVAKVGEPFRLFFQFGFVGGKSFVCSLDALVKHFGEVLDKDVVNPGLFFYGFSRDGECTRLTHFLDAFVNIWN